MELTKNFRLEEFFVSDTADKLGIDNRPVYYDYVVHNLSLLCRYVLQPIRDKFGVPMVITSGYRCERLNEAVGGSPTSDHQDGLACDFYFNGEIGINFPFSFLLYVVSSRFIPFDQLIVYDWGYHISYRDTPRRMVLDRRNKGM